MSQLFPARSVEAKTSALLLYILDVYSECGMLLCYDHMASINGRLAQLVRAHGSHP